MIWVHYYLHPTQKRSCFLFEKVHPGRLTLNLPIPHLERKMIFQTSMIMFHVNPQGCTWYLFQTTCFQWSSTKARVQGGGPKCIKVFVSVGGQFWCGTTHPKFGFQVAFTSTWIMFLNKFSYVKINTYISSSDFCKEQRAGRPRNPKRKAC